MTDEEFVRYLLGRLPDGERDRFEDRYFSDDALHEQLLAVEEELIDAYVAGRLSASDRSAFEGRFLVSPERMQKIEFARALAAMPRSAPKTPKSFLSLLVPESFGIRICMAGAAAAILAALFFVSLRPVPAPPEIAKGGEHKSDQPVQMTPAPKNGKPETGPKEHPDLAPVLAFSLMPGVRGEGDRNLVTMPAGVHRIRLQLGLEADRGFQQYAATIETAGGNRVWQGGQLAQTKNEVRVTVSSALFRAGEYAIRLVGIAPDGSTEDVAGYSFRVEQK
jgi:hypothetical protein